MGDGHPSLGHEVAHVVGRLLDVHHPVVDVEHLALAQQLAADRLPHRPVVVLADVGEDRHPIGRRRVEQREVADAGERHLQRARDRRGSEREHVDAGLQLLDLLLVAHAEALLLVHHQQAEVLEHDVVGQEPVGADDDVDLAGAQPLGHLPRLRGREEPGQHLDAHGVAGEAVAEGLVVLLGQQRGGHQHRHLLAVLHRLEGGPDGDLGLSEAHIAAHQAVHRVALLHVTLHLGDRHELVGRLLVRERLLQLALPRRVLWERVARLVDPLLVEHHELLGDLAHRGAHLGLGLLPAVAAEPAEGGRLATGVVPHRVDLV